MELDAEDAVAVGESRHRRVAAGGERAEAGRHLGDRVAVAHPYRQLAVEAFEQAGRLAYGEHRRTVLVRATGIDLAAEVVCDELHAVADAQHRNARAQRLRVDLRRAFLIYARWPPAEDQPGRIALFELGPGCRSRHQLAVDLGLAHPACDQLAELGTEIEDENCLLGHALGLLTARWSRGRPAQL